MKKILIYHLLLVFSLHMFSCKDSDNKVNQGEITYFSVWDQQSASHVLYVDNVNNIIHNKQALPTYVNLANLIAEFKTNSDDVVIKSNGKILNKNGDAINLSQEIVLDLYMGNEKQKSYVVKINKEELSNSFRSFSFTDAQMQSYQPTINEETNEITNEELIPLNIDITSLQPEFSLTDRNATVTVNGIVQKSGVARHNFAKPVIYTITGEDGTSKQFTVKLKQGTEVYLENPIVKGSYADPTVIRVGNEFYVYVTSGKVRGYKSTDLTTWSRIAGSTSEVFTERPNFTADDPKDTGMWAPDINYFDGQYVMYYSISKWSGGATCGIGVGISNKPQGPFTPPAGNTNGKLFVSSEIDVHNSIDPCFYEENGKRYLFWGSFYGLYMTELTADGMAIKNLSQKKKIAGKSFEATYIHKRGNYYYLFASIGACCEEMNSSYKVVVGRSDKLEGPYLSKTGADMNTYDTWNAPTYQPIVLQGDGVTFAGPGHNARIITDDNGVDWMLYHSFVKGVNDGRSLMLDKVTWDNDGWPLVGKGTPSPFLTELPVFN